MTIGTGSGSDTSTTCAVWSEGLFFKIINATRAIDECTRDSCIDVKVSCACCVHTLDNEQNTSLLLQ